MDVIITIIGRQTVDGGCEVTEMTAPGRMEWSGAEWKLTWRESSPEGDTDSTIRILDGGMEVERRGAIRSLLRLTPGKRQESEYDAGVGVLRMGIDTKLVQSSLTPAGGTAEARYTLDINGSVTADHVLTIDVKGADRTCQE